MDDPLELGPTGTIWNIFQLFHAKAELRSDTAHNRNENPIYNHQQDSTGPSYNQPQLGTYEITYNRYVLQT